MTEEDKQTATVLSKVAELVKTCPRFGDFDWCNEHCDLDEFCDKVYEVIGSVLP